MKKILFLLAVCLTSMAATGQKGKIEVTIETVKNDAGQIGVLLFNKPEGFPSSDKASIRQVILPAQKGRMQVSFDDLPYGVYAITVMHDENKNLKVDTNMLGIPKEGYGFSNNARNLFRAPRFHEAAFELKSPNQLMRIELMY